VSYQGDPASALLEVLDPAQNDTFTDHYLGVPFDLSEVPVHRHGQLHQSIPAPLLDRMEVVNFAGYTEEEKLQIAKSYLVPRQIEENGLKVGQLTFADPAIREVIASYTRESGVRQLERELGKLARKVARRIAAREIQTGRDPAGRRPAAARPPARASRRRWRRRIRSASRPACITRRPEETSCSSRPRRCGAKAS
jgi:ATP-dependent Lon protease